MEVVAIHCSIRALDLVKLRVDRRIHRLLEESVAAVAVSQTSSSSSSSGADSTTNSTSSSNSSETGLEDNSPLHSYEHGAHNPKKLRDMHLHYSLAMRKYVANTSHAYEQEIRRRKMALFFYLIRSPLFDSVTYPALKSMTSVLAYVPLIGSLPEFLLGILSYLNQTHFYNSNS